MEVDRRPTPSRESRTTVNTMERRQRACVKQRGCFRAVPLSSRIFCFACSEMLEFLLPKLERFSYREGEAPDTKTALKPLKVICALRTGG